ncbi:MAG: tRNA (N6-isopentenyl adenosine(37)-C2)-methylthiotransferase MiaB [Saprospiraceae bacterium]|nr:tRNA (N6-isopentenyl adenosine(37)-C2)-methylthiotransferase MiaB [Saprospiraceae bacterium]
MELHNSHQQELIAEDQQGSVLSLDRDKEFNVNRKFYIESYGCQMNFSDSEIVAAILNQEGFGSTRNIEEADMIFINTCSIREKAEESVRKRLKDFRPLKKHKPELTIGVLGCMAERLKSKFLEEEQLVDIVAGPDAYRDLPNLLKKAEDGDKGINVFLSREETYADISPMRLDENGVTAFISIMRGCDNMCSFCVVPFTRGRERSRSSYTIVSEATDLFMRGYREVTLLGQNVDSYKWLNPETNEITNFAQLLEMVAKVNPLLRVRFSTSHPKDITDEVLNTMAQNPNICKYIHLPVQSGSSRILELMNRTYDREWYKNRIQAIRQIIPDCVVSSDIITGFCTETTADHQETLNMMEWANYSMSYMFYYSERPGTPAAKKLKDDVPLEIKKARLNEIIRLQNQISHRHNQSEIGKTFEVLIEGNSKRSTDMFKGRNSQNKMIVFQKKAHYKAGDYVMVKIESASSATLMGSIVN